MKWLYNSILLFSSVLILSSCSVVAEREEVKSYSNCEISNPSWKIKTEDLAKSDACKHAHPACLPVLGIFVPAMTTIVSGSIYVVGNSIHWLEYQGKCDADTIEVEIKKREKDLAMLAT